MKVYGLILLVVFSTITLLSQENSIVKWKFKTSGKILASATIDSEIIYFGSMDSVFYALDIKSGETVWEFNTQSAIQSIPLVYGDLVYIKSKGDVLALAKDSGELLWSYQIKNDTLDTQLDLWDYHSGSPAVFDSKIYFGLSNGELIGFDLDSGQIRNRISSIDYSPNKSGLLIYDSLLFWGDWNGKIYSYNLRSNNFNWVYSTYNKQPYSTFGQIISQFSILDSLLFFGSRNPEFQVVNTNNGEKQWSYIEKNGGWISGDPLVHNDTVYVGGSDNHEMFAFNSLTGEKYWTYKFLNNNFSKPVVWKDYLLFTTGDAYNVWGKKPGIGYLYALNRIDGTIWNFYQFGGNLYSGLVIKDDLAYFGSSDGFFYCVDLLRFTGKKHDLSSKGHNAFDIVSSEPNPFADSLNISLNINYPSELQVKVLDFKENHICNIYSGEVENGPFKLHWSGMDMAGHEVDDGYYFIIINVNDYTVKTIIQKKKL